MNHEHKSQKRRWYLIGFLLILVLCFPWYSPQIQRLAGSFTGLVSRSETSHDYRIEQAQLNTLSTGLQQYKTLNRALPTTEQGLAALVTPPASASKQKQIVESSGILDPWGNPYQYQAPGKSGRNYDLWSLGPDGKNGTEDDIYRQ